MSQLEDDLKQDYERLKETLNAKDVITGLMILAGITAELAGVITVVIGAMSVINIVSGGLGSLGIPLSAGVIQMAVKKAVPEIIKQYSNLNK